MPEGGTMKKILTISLVVTGIAMAGLMVLPSFASAMGQNSNVNGNGSGYGYQQVIESKAKALGMTVEELRTQLETKTLLEIAQEKGISEDQLHEAMQKSAQERWTAKGLSQSEIDARMQRMQERQASDHECDGTGSGVGNQHNRNNQ